MYNALNTNLFKVYVSGMEVYCEGEFKIKEIFDSGGCGSDCTGGSVGVNIF